MPLAPASAVRPLRTAALDALKGIVPLVGSRVYTGLVPSGAAMPHLRIGQYTEDDESFYGRPGSEVTFRLSGFVATVDASGQPIGGDSALLALWGECYEALHRKPLPVTGHLFLEGRLRYVTDYPDPDAAALQFVAEYRGTTRVGGALS